MLSQTSEFGVALKKKGILSVDLSVIQYYIDSDVDIWTKYSLLKNKHVVVILVYHKYKLSSSLKLPFGQFDCLVGSNNSPSHLNGGLVLVWVSQEDICFVRVLCVWRCIQTDLWGIEPLESCHFYLFQFLLSAVRNCRLPIMLFTQKKGFFFYLLHPPFPSRSFHHPRPGCRVSHLPFQVS